VSLSVIDNARTSKKSILCPNSNEPHKLSKRGCPKTTEPLFKNIKVGQWQIARWVKSEHMAVRGMDRSRRCAAKKFRYESVRVGLLQNVKQWLLREFVETVETQ
jgi:hypothetical protein